MKVEERDGRSEREEGGEIEIDIRKSQTAFSAFLLRVYESQIEILQILVQ